MAEYLVLARKYRSTTFDEVVGQEPIAQTLKNAIAIGRVAHAYLFTGTRGVGKTTMARILAKALNCLSFDGPTTTPCNTCDACKAIARGEDVDVVEIDGASNRGIDEIRELRANAIFRPARSRYKIYYIDEVHMLTKEAFNALLKTLEEPPQHVKFIFATTETEKVPATILSRCQRFDFRNIPTRDIAGHLQALCKAEKVQADEDALFRIARSAAGSMRDALSLLDQLMAASAGTVSDAEVVRILGTPSDERTQAIARGIAQGSGAETLQQLDAILESGVSLNSVVLALGETFRDMMIASVCGPASDLIELPEAQRQAVGELSKKFTLPALVQAVGILQTVARNIRSSSVGRALVEAALVRLAEADKFVDAATLLQRVEALAGGTFPSGPAAAPLKKNLMPDSPAPSHAAATAAAPHPNSSNVAPAAAPAATQPQPANDAATTSSPAAGLVWDNAWLAANWRRVTDALIGLRQMSVVGLLNPGKVLSFRNDLLKLGFAGQFESLRAKCAGEMKLAIEKTLSDLAGRPIRCEFLSTERNAPTPPAADQSAHAPTGSGGAATSTHPAATRPTFGDLSMAEKAGVSNDAAIKAVLGAFGGDIADIKRDSPDLNLAPREDEEPTEQ